MSNIVSLETKREVKHKAELERIVIHSGFDNMEAALKNIIDEMQKRDNVDKGWLEVANKALRVGLDALRKAV